MKLLSLAYLMLISVCPRLQAATLLNISVEERGHPQDVGVLVASIGGSEVAVIPGAFALTINGSPEYAVRLDNGTGYYGVRLQFSYSNGQHHLDSISRDCWPVIFHGTLSQDSPQTYHLYLTYSVKESECFTSSNDFIRPPPAGDVWLGFAANPSSATVSIPSEAPFLESGLPKTVNMKYYQPKTEIVVFFKSPGYFDCAKKITITKQDARYNVKLDDESPTKLTDGNAGDDLPTISCKLIKIP